MGVHLWGRRGGRGFGGVPKPLNPFCVLLGSPSIYLGRIPPCCFQEKSMKGYMSPEEVANVAKRHSRSLREEVGGRRAY